MDRDLVPDSQIDNDIANVRSQSTLSRILKITRQLMNAVESLRHRRSLLANTLLSKRKVQNRLRHARSTASASSLPIISNALDQVETQAAANLSNLYRTCSGATAFRVRDPDPNAVDSGNVFGIRIDVFSTSERRFITPYYVLLNHPETDSDALKIHKHTIPPFIPVQQLATRYLPIPDPSTQSSDPATAQNLPAFLRALRRELVSHHKRLAALEALKTGLRSKSTSKMLDPSGKGFEIELSDGSVAQVTLSREGKIENAAVRSRTQVGELLPAVGRRQRETESIILGGNGRIEELFDRLKARSAS
jgi:central kinetochore subunit Mal2/MCM21